MNYNFSGKGEKFLFFVGIPILTILLINLLYYFNFHGSGISKSTTVWGEYGSYISGVTSILNLIVFIFLTVFVARLGEANNKRQLDIQKKLLLSQFRYSELLKIQEKINKEYEIIEVSDLKIFKDSLLKLGKNIDSFIVEKATLFPALDSQMNITIRDNIITGINSISKVIYSYNYLHELSQAEMSSFSFLKGKIEYDKYLLFSNLLTIILNDLE